MTGRVPYVARNGCPSGKFAFPSRRAARARLKKLRAEGVGVGVKDCYLCDQCGEWHLTHYDKDQTREFTRIRRGQP